MRPIEELSLFEKDSVVLEKILDIVFHTCGERYGFDIKYVSGWLWK